MDARNTSLLLLVLILLLGFPFSVSAAEFPKCEELNLHLTSYFPDAGKIDIWRSLWETVSSDSPELIGDSNGVAGLRIDGQKANFYVSRHIIALTVLPISDLENHLVIHLRNWELDAPILSGIFRWNRDQESFEQVHLTDPITDNEGLTIEIVMFDLENNGIAVHGYSGSRGNSLDMYRYVNEEYERILHRTFSMPTILDYGPPVRIEEYAGDWSECIVKAPRRLGPFSVKPMWLLRQEFTWDPVEESFVLSEETPSEIALVDMFLKAIADQNMDTATNLVAEGFAISAHFSSVIDELKGFLLDEELFLISYEDYEDYQVQESENLVLIGISYDNELSTDTHRTDALVFVFSSGDSPRIMHVWTL